MKTLIESIAVPTIDLETKPKQDISKSHEDLLLQLEQDAPSFSIEERNGLWLLRGVTLRLLGRLVEARAQFKQLIPRAPGRPRLVQILALIELAETFAREGKVSFARETLAATSYLSRQSSSQLAITPERDRMLDARLAETWGLTAAICYDPETAKTLVRMALGLTSSDLQKQQCRSLLVKLQGDEDQVRKQLRQRKFLLQRDQYYIYPEILQFMQRP